MNLQEELEREGYTIKFGHYRRTLRSQGREGHVALYQPHILRMQQWGIAPCGGLTECIITAPNGRKYIGTSKCRYDDNFVKAQGRIKALGRAYSAILSDRETA